MIFNGTAEELVDLAWCYAEAEWFPKNLEVDPCYFDGKAHPTWCLSDPESLTRSAIRPQVAAAIIFAHAVVWMTIEVGGRFEPPWGEEEDFWVTIGDAENERWISGATPLHAVLAVLEAPSTPA